MSDDATHPDMSLFLASSIHDMKNSIGILGGTLEGLLSKPSNFSTETKSQMAFMLFETKQANAAPILLSHKVFRSPCLRRKCKRAKRS
jgi:hypothetical protein